MCVTFMVPIPTVPIFHYNNATMLLEVEVLFNMYKAFLINRNKYVLYKPLDNRGMWKHNEKRGYIIPIFWFFVQGSHPFCMFVISLVKSMDFDIRFVICSLSLFTSVKYYENITFKEGCSLPHWASAALSM